MNKNYFTVVFKGDVGALPFNPLLKDDTAFGQVESVSRGDVICKRDDEYWELDKTLSMHSGGELKALSELASVTLERDQLRAKLAKATDPAYLAEKIEQVGMVDKEWQARAEAAEAKLAEYEKWSGGVDEVADSIDSIIGAADFDGCFRSLVTSALTAAHARGKAEENEACAKVADGWMTAEQIKFGKGGAGAAIRSRMGGEYETREGDMHVTGVKVSPAPASDGPGPSSTAYPVPTPVERRPKPEGYVSLAELDEMSMKPEDRT